MDRIEVRGLRASGRHGVLPGERDRPQPFLLDLTVEIDAARAASTDDLIDALDYVAVAAEARRVVVEESFALVETIAVRVAERLLALGASSATVRVSKPSAANAVGAAEVAVEVTRSQ